MPAKRAAVKPAERYQEMIQHTDQMCAELLNDEYRDMCRVMAKNLCVKGSPGLEGDGRKWAAAVVNTIGLVNFLDDPSFEPHYTRKDLAKRLGYSYGMLKKYTDVLVQGFQLTVFDPDFTLPSVMQYNPLMSLLSSPSVLLGDCCGEDTCDEAECCQAEKPTAKRKKPKQSRAK